MRFPFPVDEQVALAAHTTLGVGGPARFLTRCLDTEAIVTALATAAQRSLPTLVLGGGSNLLVADRGFEGLVLTIEDRTLTIGAPEADDHARVRVGAGVPWDALVAATVEAGLGGLECLSGIPGAVGAAPIQNIGAYGQEVATVIDTVHAVERSTGRRRSFAADACAFGYRTSRFKARDRDRWVVVGLDLRLPRTDRGQVAYRDLERRFAGDAGVPTPATVRDAVLAIRRSKSMVLDPSDPNGRSAGSFFVNPVVAPTVAAAVAAAPRAIDRPPPQFATTDGRVKLSAGWLIEAAGFYRGYEAGPVGLSTRHALALINRGDARARDVVALASSIRRAVGDRFGVTLRPEPVFVGFDQDVDSLLDP